MVAAVGSKLQVRAVVAKKNANARWRRERERKKRG